MSFPKRLERLNAANLSLILRPWPQNRLRPPQSSALMSSWLGSVVPHPLHLFLLMLLKPLPVAGPGELRP